MVKDFNMLICTNVLCLLMHYLHDLHEIFHASVAVLGTTLLIILFVVFVDGILLKEVNRLLRSDGYFVYSAPPAYRKDKDFPDIWNKLVTITSAMCWKLIARQVQTAIWVKQENNSCLQHSAEQHLVNLCDSADDSKPSWKTPLRNCVTLSNTKSNSKKLPPRPQRLSEYSQSLAQIGLFNPLLFYLHIYLKLWLILLCKNIFV